MKMCVCDCMWFPIPSKLHRIRYKNVFCFLEFNFEQSKRCVIWETKQKIKIWKLKIPEKHKKIQLPFIELNCTGFFILISKQKYVNVWCFEYTKFSQSLQHTTKKPIYCLFHIKYRGYLQKINNGQKATIKPVPF